MSLTNLLTGMRALEPLSLSLQSASGSMAGLPVASEGGVTGGVA